ncbi:MAG TPA: hypothetical protein PK052_04890 [Anaerohalosphaeraceae bacterium]|nr:hypothetical protein [Anaerohalosphaeraceae bacterium]HOL31298.1 hypothetical protein [Anaerohalosphaeraceae bacterium]HOM76968.1 hypothetical protein [Anaerohalosphaeraceae bacterium]HPC64752.1 hypothetical protein [Anaerohalosphaeraceae bacterium]HRS71812.1 hypothetical protein [Anaerohalosphaeraceae bacterium]
MIRFDCSKCEHNYRVPDEYAGKRIRCKACDTVITIPAPETETVKCGDSIATYNRLLEEMSKYEKQAPAIDSES